MDYLQIYNELQTELLIDMDMSGGVYLEYQNLTENGGLRNNNGGKL
ncbi:MAG: hypothetical protein WAW57_15295 [Lutibacter sp.]